MLLFSCFIQVVAQTNSFEYVPVSPKKRTVQLPDFTVTLKDIYLTPPAAYKMPPKLFVLSDIEGEYDAFKKMLFAAGVMDQQFNWTFGAGHLVLCGDMLDRGAHVAECLWLIYYLEDKAKASGGMVHYILGNHEQMNLNGDFRYVNPKYLELAKEAGVDYNQFYSNNTELGQWLRTKNIMEKIGNRLFLHGGVSHYINEAARSLVTINTTARQYIDKSEDSLNDMASLILLDDGPLWYRGYIMEPLASKEQVDSTLVLFNVNKIVVGHTLVPQITSFFGGKVVGIDVPHAKGFSEGLLIENKKQYRINLKGDRILLPNK